MNFKKWFHKICQSVWTIGFIETDIDDILEGKPYHIRWVDISDECWYADPFILRVTDECIELLVEKWSYELERGIIAKIAVDRKSNKLISSKTVLQLDTHLSFPTIYRIDGKVYVCPENSESGCHYIYEYNEMDDAVSLLKCICMSPLTDAIATDMLGEHLLFSTQSGNSNGKDLDVFRWNSANSMFEKSSTVSFDENIARMAGHFFEHKGSIYRPAQVCNSAYGQAVSLQKVIMREGKVNMEEIRRLYSTHRKLRNGMHTFNYSQGVIVVDAWGWKAPLLRKLFVDDWGNMKNWVKWFA